MGWSHFPHGADIGVRGVAGTVAESFAQAAVALTAVVVDPARVRSTESRRFSCSAPDLELLLVDWLNALVYAMAAERLVFGSFEVAIDGTSLAATAWGEPLDRERHRPAIEVKGATYTALSVARGPDGNWTAQCVVDV